MIPFQPGPPTPAIRNATRPVESTPQQRHMMVKFLPNVTRDDCDGKNLSHVTRAMQRFATARGDKVNGPLMDAVG